jgi:hypothetical protein
MSARLGSARTWRVVLGVLVVASFAAMVPLTVLSGQIFDALVAAAIGVPCAAVGWLVTRRQPGNPIGWLFLVTGVFPHRSNPYRSCAGSRVSVDPAGRTEVTRYPAS